MSPPLDPQRIKLFYEPEGRLRITTDDRSYLSVRPAWSAPLTQPGKWLALVDGKGREIATFEDPNVVGQENLAIIETELKRRYLSPVVKEILSAKLEFGVAYWTVVTDRGVRDFVTQNLQENAVWLSATHLVLVDVDGNRFEFTDTSALDPISRAKMREVL